MTYYLLDHPPAHRQFLTRRRKPETGCIVIHTPEGGVDLQAPDLKAEQVARYISTRNTAGSYHAVCDSDSTLLMMPWTYEAAQDGTGSNPWAVGLSIACDAADWPKLLIGHPWWVDGALNQLAKAAASYAADLRSRTGIVIPARRINRAESDAGKAGFISHAERDPGRRSDPGSGFPWGKFLDLYATATDDGDSTPQPPPAQEVDEMLYVVKAQRPDGTIEDQAWLTDLRGRQPINSQPYLDLLTSPYMTWPNGPVVGGGTGGWYHAWTKATVDAIPPAPIDVDALAAAIVEKLPIGSADPTLIADATADELARRLVS